MKPTEPKKIDVTLTVLNEIDVLIFSLDEDNPEKYKINLNSSTSQSEIKDVFAKLLEILIENDILLELKIADGYSKGLYKDVCTEYISDLNREIQQIKITINQTLK